MVDRRDFLKYTGLGIVAFALGAGVGYTLKPTGVGEGAKTVTVTKTQKFTETVTQTVTGAEKLKAAWIYVGPISDYGWTHAHDIGRKEAETAFPWLETSYVENIDEAKTRGAIEQFISEGYKVIFTTSFDHMNPTFEAAKDHSDIVFFHCSGYKRRDNMGTYFADLYQAYYLNGLMAGALTKTNKIGYVAAHLTPEVIRHINAFAIGIKEVNPDAKVYVIKIGAWYAPDKAREAAATLVENYCDVLAFTEDSPSTIQFAQSYYEDTGKLIPVFSHYSPMYEYGKDVVVSGQVVRWGKIYIDILSKVYSGFYTTKNLKDVDYWWLLDTGAVDVGAKTYDDQLWINSKFKTKFDGFTVTEKYTGSSMSLTELIEYRYSQMKDRNMVFDPFTGPLSGTWYLSEGGTVLGKEYSPGDPVEIPKGVRLGHDDLWGMGWFVDNVIIQSE